MKPGQQQKLSALDALAPEVAIALGGKSYQLRWDYAALYEMQAYTNDLEVSGEYRKLLTMVWCMLVDPHPFKAPKELAQHIPPKESVKYMQLVVEAMKRGAQDDLPGVEDGDPDPLPETGPSPVDGSA